MKTNIKKFVKDHKGEIIIGCCGVACVVASVVILKNRPCIPVSRDCLVTDSVKLSQFGEETAQRVINDWKCGLTMDSTVFMVIEP